MAKYYQHLDATDESTFGKVTTLQYIDDEDPDMVLYYFSDGTKCNELFISGVDNADAANGQYIMAEVASEKNVWKFTKNIVNQEHKIGTARNSDGNTQQYDIPDPYFINQYGNANTKLSSANESGVGNGIVAAGVRYNAEPPRKTVVPVEDSKEYCLSYINYAKEHGMAVKHDVGQQFDFNQATEENNEKFAIRAVTSGKNTKQNIDIAPSPEKEEPISENVDDSSVLEETGISEVAMAQPLAQFPVIEVDELVKEKENVTFIYKGKKYEYSCTDIIDCLIDPKKKPSMYGSSTMSQDGENDIKIDIINTPEWGLVNNMINMSNKDICTIDMELELTLPPTDVYKLIKTVYPEGMADAFVKTIANRMSVKDLKEALAFGLLNYYDQPVQQKSTSTTSAAEQLEKLQALKDNPVISSEKGTKKKADINNKAAQPKRQYNRKKAELK